MLKTSLYKHQQIAFNKLKKYTVGALFMDMGTGKTRTTLEFIKHRKEKVSNIIWICPVSVKPSLMKELEKHCDYSFCDLSNDFFEADIYVVGWESIASSDRVYLLVRELIYKDSFIIGDESIFIKTHNAKRTKRAIEISDICKYKLILNGTPISKNEADLYSQFRFLSAKILGFNSFYSFAANHLVYSEKYPNVISKVLKPEIITEKINPFVYQIKKEECFDMPEKTDGCIYFNISKKATQVYDFVKDKILQKIIEDEEDETIIFQLFNNLQAITSGYTDFFPNRVDFDLSEKLKTLTDYIECTNSKIIVVCKYKNEIEKASENIKDRELYFYHGGRKDNLSDWLSTENGILICNEKCAGFGHNLQECSNMIFFSNTFNYADRKQMIDRIYRPGQKNKTIINTMVACDTIDEYIQKNLLSKERKASNLDREINKMKNDFSFINKVCGGFKDGEKIS